MIHPLAIIEDGAQIAEGAEIGPFCHVGANVVVGAGVNLISHVAVAGHTRIGANTKVFPFASLGHEPQDLKYAGEQTELIIGDNCLIREGVTMNPGTGGDKSKTLVGNGCAFLANSHVAHDCLVGNGVILSNNVMLAGHVEIGNHVIVGGGAGIHQFCRIGNNAFVGGIAGVENDVIPFGMALGNRAYLGGLNLVGMKRAGFAREQIHGVRKAFKILWSGNKPVAEMVEIIAQQYADNELVAQIVEFVKASGDRSLCVPQ